MHTLHFALSLKGAILKSKAVKTKPYDRSYNHKKLLLFLTTSFIFFKFVIIQNIEFGAWIGADGENYLTGFISILEKGIFSNDAKLTYWPAGYPIFIYLLSFLGKNYVLATVAIVQSVIFSVATYYFASTLIKSKLKKYSISIFMLLNLNPTLSLSSMVIGYESITASGILILFGLIYSDFQDNNYKKFKYKFFVCSIIVSILSFFQPRLFIIGIFMNLLWLVYRRPKNSFSLFLVFSLFVSIIFPSFLIYRNYKAVNQFTISTNLGVTMSLGAGKGATGGYLSPNRVEIPCDTSGSESEVDRKKVMCALRWYAENPLKFIQLAIHKSIYFWSPWFGPTFNGTMARNPWLKINPIRDITKTPDGAKLVFGDLGKFISYTWELMSLAVLIIGLWVVWKLGRSEKFLALLCLVVITLSMITTWLTLGDNRFRVPIMGATLFLQAVGLRTLSKGGRPLVVGGSSLR